MSKETMGATVCPGCTNYIHFMDYHIPHCSNKGLSPEPVKEKRRRRRRRGRKQA